MSGFLASTALTFTAQITDMYFGFLGTGAATVECYELGAETPSSSRSISWGPAGAEGGGHPDLQRSWPPCCRPWLKPAAS